MSQPMFTSEDFRIHSVQELMEFLPIVIFIGFIAPFLILAYTIGFFGNLTGWLD